MLEIRQATTQDADAITRLLTELGYPGTEVFIKGRLARLLSHPDETLLIAALNGTVAGVISLHFIPQLALPGDFCRISYFCIAETSRNSGIGAALESRAEEIAREQGCDRIEVHCHSRRTDAHRFYARQGYIESPKYLFKQL